MEESRPSRSSARIALLLLLLLPPRTFGQVLREAPTPYHFVRYEDVPADQQSLAWPDDFWAPIKFIPLDIVPGSWVNFGGELRERVEHFSNPFFDLTPRGNTTYDMHRLLLQADLHIGEMFRAFVQFGNHLVTSPSMSPPTDVDRLDRHPPRHRDAWHHHAPARSARRVTSTSTAPDPSAPDDRRSAAVPPVGARRALTVDPRAIRRRPGSKSGCRRVRPRQRFAHAAASSTGRLHRRISRAS
jgi:Alginate export